MLATPTTNAVVQQHAVQRLEIRRDVHAVSAVACQVGRVRAVTLRPFAANDVHGHPRAVFRRRELAGHFCVGQIHGRLTGEHRLRRGLLRLHETRGTHSGSMNDTLPNNRSSPCSGSSSKMLESGCCFGADGRLALVREGPDLRRSAELVHEVEPACRVTTNVDGPMKLGTIASLPSGMIVCGGFVAQDARSRRGRPSLAVHLPAKSKTNLRPGRTRPARCDL